MPTLTFGTLYVVLVISQACRRIEYLNITARPTAAWTWQQLIEAAAWNSRPRYLIRDRDRVYGRDFVAQGQRLGIATVLTPLQTPQANAAAKRWLGTRRRKCLSHIIPFNARHLRRLVAEFVTYDSETRPHRTLQLNAPVGRDSATAASSRRTCHSLTIRILWS